LEKAKAAVALDANDPENWETLGNAYVGDFFVNARRPDELNRALIAYGKGEACYAKLGKSNPSLQLNRGMAAKYIEDYELAIRSFRKAHEIGSPKAAKEGQEVMELVQRLAGDAQRKCDLKPKDLKELLEDLEQRGEVQRSLRDLRTDVGSADAPVAAKVVHIVDRQDELPVIVMCCDAFGDFFALSLYNADLSKVADAVVPMKSVLYIRQPKFREVSVTANHKTWTYPCVRVAHPGDVTVLGSGSLGAAAMQSLFTAAALPREPQTDSPVAASSAVESSVARAEGRADASPTAQNDEVEVQLASQVDSKHERWIDQEDAKMKKEEAKAKARAKAKSKTKGKARKKDRATEKVDTTKARLEADSNVGKVNVADSDAELETNTGSESWAENDKDEKETVEEVEEDAIEIPSQKLSAVRWSDLDDSDSDDGRLPRERVAPPIAHPAVTA
jgi:hypothetical protein